MPGSLSNEDEGQDDMDFEDDMPGEGKGGGAVSFRYFTPLRLECGEKGLSCVLEDHRGGGVGCNKQSHAIIFARSTVYRGTCLICRQLSSQYEIGHYENLQLVWEGLCRRLHAGIA